MSLRRKPIPDSNARPDETVQMAHHLLMRPHIVDSSLRIWESIAPRDTMARSALDNG